LHLIYIFLLFLFFTSTIQFNAYIYNIAFNYFSVDLLFYWYSERAMFIKTFAIVFSKKMARVQDVSCNGRHGNWTFPNKSNAVSSKNIKLKYLSWIKLPKSHEKCTSVWVWKQYPVLSKNIHVYLANAIWRFSLYETFSENAAKY